MFQEEYIQQYDSRTSFSTKSAAYIKVCKKITIKSSTYSSTITLNWWPKQLFRCCQNAGHKQQACGELVVQLEHPVVDGHLVQLQETAGGVSDHVQQVRHAADLSNHLTSDKLLTWSFMFIGVYWSRRPSDVTMRRDDTMVWVTWWRSVPDKLKMNINTFYSAAAALVSHPHILTGDQWLVRGEVGVKASSHWRTIYSQTCVCSVCPLHS